MFELNLIVFCQNFNKTHIFHKICIKCIPMSLNVWKYLFCMDKFLYSLVKGTSIDVRQKFSVASLCQKTHKNMNSKYSWKSSILMTEDSSSALLGHYSKFIFNKLSVKIDSELQKMRVHGRMYPGTFQIWSSFHFLQCILFLNGQMCPGT